MSVIQEIDSGFEMGLATKSHALAELSIIYIELCGMC